MKIRDESQKIFNPVSKEIINNKLRVKLSMIFEKFDKNKNGKISADEIDIENVPMELIIIFKPLLLEMEAYQESLDKDEFVESSLALVQVSISLNFHIFRLVRWKISIKSWIMVDK
jgi:hypothetical protein